MTQWKAVAKGTVQACVCDSEGCCSTLAVLSTEENVLEIYQASTRSLWSCVARIVLPDDIALCRRAIPTTGMRARQSL